MIAARSIRAATVILLASGLLSTATARGSQDAPRPMTPEDVVSVRTIADPRLAPDGSAVAFVVSTPDLAANRVGTAIWLHEAGAGSARPLTHAEADHAAPRFSPDGRSIAFLSDREERTQVWLLPLAGGEPRRLTDSPTEVSTHAWSPDGEQIAYTAAVPRTEADRVAREAGDDAYLFDVATELPKLWLIAIDSGQSRQVTTAELAIQEMAFAADGRSMVVAARPSTVLDRIGETELYRVDLATGALERLTDNAAVESSPLFDGAGSGVLYTAADPERFVNGESKLFRLDLDSGAIERLAPSYPHGLHGPRLARDGSTVWALAGVRARHELVEVDTASGRVQARVAGPGSVLDWDAPAGDALAYVYSDPTRTPDLWWTDGDHADGRRVTDLNPQQGEWRLGATSVVSWASSDGSEVEGLLTLPPDHATGQRHPLVVKLHGGPEAAEILAHEPGYLDYHQLLAGAGWAVLRPNYRGGSNYGDAWIRGMNGETGGGDYEDIMSGVDHLIDIGVADPERMVVMGWSWGGISTGWIVTQTDRFAAAAAGAMVSDHFSVFGQADLTFDVEHFYIGGSPWEDPVRYLSMSPIGHVMKATTPTLLLHGEDDERCPLPQSVEFFKGLRAAGVTTELVVYPREPHVFREPRHRLDKIERELAWFGRHALGDAS